MNDPVMDKVYTRIHLRLEFVDRWAVTAPADPWASVDLPLHSTPTSPGAFHIPGSSLAGALKAHLGPAGEAWLGRDPGDAEATTGTLDLAAGRLWILGISPVRAITVHRGTTAVSRRSGSAAGRMLRNETTALPTGFDLTMEHDGPADADLLGRLANWRPTLGRARTTGLGRAYVARVRSVTADLSAADDLTWWLGDRDRWPDVSAPARLGQTDTNAEVAPPRPPPVTTDRAFRWRVAEPVHVGSGEKAAGGSAETLGSDGRLLVPGSSWKGVFRHRVGVILRALGADDDDRERVTAYLFGSLAGGRGALIFRDAWTDTAAGTRSHVAIDRFTGGAVDGGLYAVDAIPAGTIIEQRIGIPHDFPKALATLLTLVARDLHDGLAGLGRGSGRGYGWLTFADEPPQTDVVSLESVLAAVPATGAVS